MQQPQQWNEQQHEHTVMHISTYHISCVYSTHYQNQKCMAIFLSLIFLVVIRFQIIWTDDFCARFLMSSTIWARVDFLPIFLEITLNTCGVNKYVHTAQLSMLLFCIEKCQVFLCCCDCRELISLICLLFHHSEQIVDFLFGHIFYVDHNVFIYLCGCIHVCHVLKIVMKKKNWTTLN